MTKTSEAKVTFLRRAHRLKEYWPFNRFYFPGYISSWLYSKVAEGTSDYSTKEQLLVETLKTRPWNHSAWYQMGALLTEANQSFEAEKCYLAALKIAGAQQKKDRYTEASEAARRGLKISLGNNFKDQIEEIDDFLTSPVYDDLPKFGNSRIPIGSDYLGNPICANNARSPYLQCAVNPLGNCNDCQDFRDLS